MAITSVKVHPAIGFARLGNSPDEFFIGPEKLWDPPDPTGGFKDSECRVKRQAARFRLFAYHDNGTVEEITADDADISWTVHLANRKAINRNTGSASSLTIDPGSRTLTGPNQVEEFDTGQITLPGASAVTVPLGEARTDDAGRLLVLGGFGTSASPTNTPLVSFYDNPGWYDDVSDGPVTAHVTLSSGTEFDATPAWVICPPPKFAPQLDNVITLYDRLFDMAVAQGWATAPSNPSYTDDVYPILERARTTQWVEQMPPTAHTWADPVYNPAARIAIFLRIADPTGSPVPIANMPQLNDATLTPTQYGVMQDWRDGTFVQDWAGPPTPAATVTPAGLDEAALTACVGAAFFPGIEAGGIGVIPITNPANYVGASDPLRLNASVLSPGSITQYMAVPWQSDFQVCGDNWWPVPRPNDVIPEGTTTSVKWSRGVGDMPTMVSDWHKLGFVVKQDGEYVEVDRCDTMSIALTTQHLNFQDVPAGPMGTARTMPLAVTFEVISPGGPVTLEVQAGEGPTHPRLTLDAPSVTVGPTTGTQVATARLFVLYQTGPAGEAIDDELTVRHLASGRSWVVPITANTIARKVAAAALVLDRSGSMSEDRGDGQSKISSLRQAAGIFVDLMFEGDAVGVVRYNQSAQPLQAATTLGPPTDPARQSIKDLINGTALTPSGETSIGDGIHTGRQALNAAAGTFDVKSLVVVTDGNENRPRWISEVGPEINEQTYAVGIGRPENTSAVALQTISGNNGGYLLVTGPITGANQFVLQKNFVQILAGINNAEVALDPDGTLLEGHEQRIPFLMTEADSGVEVILLTEHPHAVDFRVQTPNGFMLEPWRAEVEPGAHWSIGNGMAFYRFTLPTELVRARYDHGGTWHAVLTIGRPRLRSPSPPEGGLHAGPLPGGDVTLATAGELGEQARPMPSRRIPPRTGSSGPPPAGWGARMAAASVSSSPGAAAGAERGRTLPYSLIVHTYSSVSLRASLEQSSHEVGASATLLAHVSESGLPARTHPTVWAETTRPDGVEVSIPLEESGPGEFVGELTMTQPGLYRCRVRASGHSRAGYPWLREHTVTGAVWRGGDETAGSPGGDPLVSWLDEERERLCELLRCVTVEGGGLSPEAERWARAIGVDVAQLRRCLAAYCNRT